MENQMVAPLLNTCRVCTHVPALSPVSSLLGSHTHLHRGDCNPPVCISKEQHRNCPLYSGNGPLLILGRKPYTWVLFLKDFNSRQSESSDLSHKDKYISMYIDVLRGERVRDRKV